ncbi:hypothetical protein, partial [Bacillus atrophaeus]|nr:hypothetical protein [Bacillus atrophaeus]
MTTSSLKSQINIRSRSLQDVMQAASKTQLELFETLKKQNVALNRTNLLPKMYTSDMLKSSGVESAMDQLRMTLKTTNYNEKYFQHIKNTLETHKKNLMNDLYFNKAQIATDMKSLLNTVVKVQANLHSSINVTNEELPSEIIYEI